MKGQAISSGEFIIKYASYHPKNIWDKNADTSWASVDPCTPGSCWFGFRFVSEPPPVKCIKIEHPKGAQYHADSISFEVLGKTGWEGVSDFTLLLLPEGHENEL